MRDVRHWIVSLMVAASVGLLGGCGTEVSADPGLPDDEGGDTSDTPDTPPDSPPVDNACTKMDFLFVIDDSGSMAEEQSNLASNFPLFLDVIENYVNENGAGLDYRIAVTTTGRDLDYTLKLPPPFNLDIPTSEDGDNGALRRGCGLTDPWIDRDDPDVASAFSCLANVGTGGPSIEMPLYAIELAFTDRLSDGANSGFLRDDALLSIVILTDEDDCSRQDNGFETASDTCSGDDPLGMSLDVDPIEPYIAFLDTLTGARGRWAATVIAGPNRCTSSFGDAFDASRLQDFVAQVGTNATFSSICEGDLASAIEDVLDTSEAACNEFPPIE